MSEFRKQFDAINAVIESLMQDEKSICNKISSCIKERDEIFRKIILDEMILSSKKWVLKVDVSGAGRLVCKESSGRWTELSKFAETNYHCVFPLQNEKDVLRFNDGEISILIYDLSQLERVVSTYGLDIEMDKTIAASIKKMEVALNELNKWKDIIHTDERIQDILLQNT